MDIFDTNQYLNFNSCYPKHTKTNVPYCLVRWICSIVSYEERRKKWLLELEEYLEWQNYPRNVILKGIEKATSLSVAERRSPKEKIENEKALLLVITHNPNNPPVINKIKCDIQFLNNSEKMKSVLENMKLIVTCQQPKKLEEMIDSSAIYLWKNSKHSDKMWWNKMWHLQPINYRKLYEVKTTTKSGKLRYTRTAVLK